MAKRAAPKKTPKESTEPAGEVRSLSEEVGEPDTPVRCPICGGLPEDHVDGVFTDGVCYLRCTCAREDGSRCPQHDDAYRLGDAR